MGIWSDRSYFFDARVDGRVSRFEFTVYDDEFSLFIRDTGRDAIGSGRIDSDGIISWNADSVASDHLRAIVHREIGDRLI